MFVDGYDDVVWITILSEHRRQFCVSQTQLVRFQLLGGHRNPPLTKIGDILLT